MQPVELVENEAMFLETLARDDLFQPPAQDRGRHAPLAVELVIRPTLELLEATSGL
jgi:hypothetical protein